MTWSVRFRDRVALAICLERVDQRLHRLAVTFFVATFVACTIHFGVGWLPEGGVPVWIGRWLTMANAFFPAVGAALIAIRNQGEFQRVAQSSRRAGRGAGWTLARRVRYNRAAAMRRTQGELTGNLSVPCSLPKSHRC